MSSRSVSRKFWYERAKHLRGGKRYIELADSLYQKHLAGEEVDDKELWKVHRYFARLDQLEYNILHTGRQIARTREHLHSDFSNFVSPGHPVMEFDGDARAYDK